jgi:hypothetical protein
VGETAPVGPNIQDLRDAERLSAWDQLGERNRVLDIASESNVTAGLDADHVTRLDFSLDAIEYAREVLVRTSIATRSPTLKRPTCPSPTTTSTARSRSAPTIGSSSTFAA